MYKRQVFYVLDSLVAEFEQAIKDAFGDVIVPMGAELASTFVSRSLSRSMNVNLLFCINELL